MFLINYNKTLSVALLIILLCLIDALSAVHLTKEKFNEKYNLQKIRIDLSSMNITSISTDLLEDADQVQTLWINHNPYFDFPINKSILNAKYLRYFYCTNNSVSYIDEETFKLLPAIDSIYLDYNKIEHISPLAFIENLELINLRLSHNNISLFVFEHPFPRLEELHLNNNFNFNFVPDKPMMEAPQLQLLKVSYCGINTIYTETFRKLPKIDMINFSNNQIEKFHEDAFQHNHELKELIFDYNPIKSIRFRSKSVELLSCNNCHICTLHIENLRDIPNLKELQLNNNRIKQITPYSFFHNVLIATIYLEGNAMESMAIQSIIYLSALRSLCLDFNPFISSYEMTKFIKYYKSNGLRRNCQQSKSSHFFEEILPIIDIENSLILDNVNRFPDWFQTFNATNQNLTYIEPMLFENYSQLQTLILNENHDYKFWKDSPFLFNKVLSKFECQYCGIGEIYKSTFMGIPNLRELIMSNNNIHELSPGVFDSNKHLERVDLSYNKLSKIMYIVLDSAENLVFLTLDNNQDFDFYPKKIFLYNEKFQYFSCNFCGIKQIYKETFEKLRSLRYLFLNNNSIEAIENESFLNNQMLESVHLDGNKLITFDVSIVQNLPSLVILCLDNNKNYEFSYSENNYFLRYEYNNRKLRSQKCGATTFNQRFEINLIELVSDRSNSNNLNSRNAESTKFLEITYDNSSTSIQYLSKILLATIMLILCVC